MRIARPRMPSSAGTCPVAPQLDRNGSRCPVGRVADTRALPGLSVDDPPAARSSAANRGSAVSGWPSDTGIFPCQVRELLELHFSGVHLWRRREPRYSEDLLPAIKPV